MVFLWFSYGSPLYQASTILFWWRLVYFCRGTSSWYAVTTLVPTTPTQRSPRGRDGKDADGWGVGHNLRHRDPGNHSWWWVSTLNMLLYYIYIYIYLHIDLHISKYIYVYTYIYIYRVIYRLPIFKMATQCWAISDGYTRCWICCMF